MKLQKKTCFAKCSAFAASTLGRKKGKEFSRFTKSLDVCSDTVGDV